MVPVGVREDQDGFVESERGSGWFRWLITAFERFLVLSDSG